MSPALGAVAADCAAAPDLAATLAAAGLRATEPVGVPPGDPALPAATPWRWRRRIAPGVPRLRVMGAGHPGLGPVSRSDNLGGANLFAKAARAN